MKRLAIAAAISLVVLAGCTSDPVELQPDGPRPSDSTAPVPSPDPEPQEEEAAPTYGEEEVTLSFAGDVHFEGNLRKMLNKPDSLAPIADQLGSADYTMVNMESALTTRGAKDRKGLESPGNRYHFRTDSRALTLLSNAGVDVVTVANNHGADYGLQGVKDTVKLKQRFSIVGVGKNRADAYAPHIAEIKGTTFAFFGADGSFLESKSPGWEVKKNMPGLAYARREGLATLADRVNFAHQNGQVPVVYVHWGTESSAAVNSEQVKIAKRLSEAGAAIVVGAHAHRPQASGWLRSGNGPERKPTTYVSYGLGNFLWYHGNEPDSGILNLTVKQGRVVQDQWTPLLIGTYGGVPTVLEGDAKAVALTQWAELRRFGPSVAGEVQYELPNFKASVSSIDEALARRMASSYSEDCPVPLEALSYMTVSYYGFDDKTHEGELVVARDQTGEVADVFARLYEARFPIKSMKLVSDFNGSDARSMAANNTSGFNCRQVAGTDRWSNHAYGTAIDINPVQNPYVRGDVVDPPAGREYAYVSRAGAEAARGVVTENGVVVQAFKQAGWSWGNKFQDYQHFSANGS